MLGGDVATPDDQRLRLPHQGRARYRVRPLARPDARLDQRLHPRTAGEWVGFLKAEVLEADPVTRGMSFTRMTQLSDLRPRQFQRVRKNTRQTRSP